MTGTSPWGCRLSSPSAGPGLPRSCPSCSSACNLSSRHSTAQGCRGWTPASAPHRRCWGCRGSSRPFSSFFFFLLLLLLLPMSPARREEVDTAIDTDDETDDSRERSWGGVGDHESSGTSGSSLAGVSSISAGGSGISACISTGGSAGLDEDDGGVFLPFPRPRVDDIFFLGGMLIAWCLIMLQCRKAAAYMDTLSRDSGTLDMHSSYARHTLDIRWRMRTILYFQGHFVGMKIILFIRNSYISLIHNSLTGLLVAALKESLRCTLWC